MKIFLIAMCVIVGFGYTISMANAESLSASQLYDLCTAPRDSAPESDCAFYISGFAAGLLAGQLVGKGNADICLPTNITGLQAELVAKKYMAAYPETLNGDAMTVLTAIFSKAFPCNQKSP